MRRLWRGLGIAAAALWLLVIWGNSLQTAAESSQTSRGVLSFFLPLLSQSGLPEDIWHTLIRKLAHLTEFAVAGFLWTAALSPGRTAPGARWMRRGAALLICLSAALVDETVQRFVPGRSGELRDVAIDLLGGAIGILSAAVIQALSRLRRKM